jgi:hypothetical protein
MNSMTKILLTPVARAILACKIILVANWAIIHSKKSSREKAKRLPRRKASRLLIARDSSSTLKQVHYLEKVLKMCLTK